MSPPLPEILPAHEARTQSEDAQLRRRLEALNAKIQAATEQGKFQVRLDVDPLVLAAYRKWLLDAGYKVTVLRDHLAFDHRMWVEW